jgi:hypothetical protein
MKSYKPLLSSAPAHSILNARTFHYRNSADTDIRKTFARLRRNATNKDVRSGMAPNVRAFATHSTEASPLCVPRPLRQASG